MNVVNLPAHLIGLRAGSRPVDEAKVKVLAESIREVGLLNPVTVVPGRRVRNGVEVDGWDILAGQHRFKAMFMILNWREIPCRIHDGNDLQAELAMIDENLCRSELSPAERAKQTSRRKDIYEELHPESQHGGARASRKLCDLKTQRFTADTASSTGKSERIVQLDAERGTKISNDALDLVAGTALDNGAFLDRLKKVNAEQQVEHVQRELAAPRKPVAPAPTPLNESDSKQAWLARIVKLADGAPQAWRDEAAALLSGAVAHSA